MAIKYGKPKNRQHNLVYTIITAVVICVVFLSMVAFLYNKTREDEYENLHIQTKQIKDDIILQLVSDRENLATMASFAAKLYRDGEGYGLLFESFKPIGMIENIGILNPDNTFSTKAGTVNMTGSISFAEEKEKGVYISGRIKDITKTDYELIRSAVPIEVNGVIVGILYGAIKPEKLGDRYKGKVEELDAQLFVYQKGTGDILVDTVQESLGNISFLKDRQYNEGTSYEQLVTTDKGFVSFRSTLKNENLHLHYSSIDELGWMIAFGRYDSQVFAGTHSMSLFLLIIFLIIMGVIVIYISILMANERRANAVTECASDVRKKLLEITEGQNNIQEALVEICQFAKSRSAIFFDTDGEFYHYIAPEYEQKMLSESERRHFKAELFRYAFEFHNSNSAELLNAKPNRRMQKTNPFFYSFLKENDIKDVSLSATINKSDNITMLTTINAKRGKNVRMFADKFSTMFRCVTQFNKITGNPVNVLCIKPNRHMLKTNPDFYKFLREHGIKEVSLSATINNVNHITILAAINAKRSKQVRMLAEKTSACFSMALYNKNNLNKTILAATTDSLTGVLNRVAYKKDLTEFDEQQASNFACVYIDVNELHLYNNKYGHAAGDQMLLYIANALKEAFCGHKIYRMGGDEFLVFCEDTMQAEVEKGIEFLHEQLKPRNFHVAIGTSYRTKNTNTEEMVREAEVEMYEAKTLYYQNKEKQNTLSEEEVEYVYAKTGISEIDTMISVLKENYTGIYRVSLATDMAKRILMPAYLKYNENEENFSKLFSEYIEETVDADSHRAVFSFLNYEVLNHKIEEGETPQITYKKSDGGSETLTVYKLCDAGETDTLWVLQKSK